MKTNFFELITELPLKGSLQITIAPGENETLAVSLLIAGSNNQSQGKLPPMLLKGTAQELGEKFFELITAPVKETFGFYTNLESYNKQLDSAKKAAKPAKDKDAAKGNGAEERDEQATESGGLFDAKADDKEAKAEKKRVYEQAMQSVKDLNAQMKYTEAIALLPDANDYPDKAAELEAKRKDLQKRQEMFESLQKED